MNHSENVANFGVQLDYLGILLLMWGAMIPIIYYGLQCDPHLRIVYWTFVRQPTPLLRAPTHKDPSLQLHRSK